MPGARYSPFDKELRDLSVQDLQVLRTVPEGWYIEYKQALPSTRSIAKSVSALANTYGGWLFYGIKEAKSGDRTAEEFPGIPTADTPQAEMHIRQAASTLISPSPFFETRVLHGPDDTIGLAAGMAIIVVAVPLSPDAPHVHGDGRIYRRVADESNPLPETDRHFLDLLWQRGEQRRKRLKELLETTPPTSEVEKEASYLELFLLPSDWGERFPRKHIQFQEFADLMTDAERDSGGLPFDNVFASSGGYIARQAKNNLPERLLLTWRYTFDGTSHITIPFSSRGLSYDPDTYKFFDGYTQSAAFFRECHSRGLNSGVIVDLNFAFAALWGVMRRHEKLAASGDLSFPYEMKIRVRGVWRRIPFLDTSMYKDFIGQFGVPVIQTEDAAAPAGNWLFALESRTDEQTAEDWTLVKSGLAFGLVCQTFGLPIEKVLDPAHWGEEVPLLIDRAQKAQQFRNAMVLK